ncbi:3762_t:CDS:1, partial [Acaulospora colombiana]
RYLQGEDPVPSWWSIGSVDCPKALVCLPLPPYIVTKLTGSHERIVG